MSLLKTLGKSRFPRTNFYAVNYLQEQTVLNSSCGTARYNADEQGDFEPYHAAFLAARLCIRGDPCPPRLGGRGSGGISL